MTLIETVSHEIHLLKIAIALEDSPIRRAEYEKKLILSYELLVSLQKGNAA